MRVARRRQQLIGCALIAAASGACTEARPEPSSAPIGDPLVGLTEQERGQFELGAAHFRRIFTEAEGLGPRFNENACNACHTDPRDGGTGEQLVVKASIHSALGTCDAMVAQGGPNLRRRVTSAAAELGAIAVPIPDEATHTGRFTTPFLFGLGMLEAVPLERLEELTDQDDSDGDGVSGRLGSDAEGRPARFGRKANVATLQDFVSEAFRLEMGLTTPGHGEGAAGNVPAVGESADPTSEPEVDAATLAATTAFVRFLAPPERVPLDQIPGAANGAQLFTSLGCATCHVPTLRTGPSDSPSLDRQTVAAYTDLLLHDMGPELSGPCSPGAGPQEYRTEPLMGLRYRQTYLHDGRAGRVRDAILMHGGEAGLARARFAALDRVIQEDLIAFLGTL